MYNYEPYRKLLKKKGVEQETLIKQNVINRGNASSLKQNKPLNVNTLEKLCTYFNCQFSDLIEHIQDISNEP